MNSISHSAKIPKVVILILSYNAKRYLIGSIQSALDSSYPNVSVLVVDNDSTDGSPEAVYSNFPQVILIRSTKNLGFGGGNNIGIRQAIAMKADYILLMNDDAFVEKDTVSLLVQFLEDNTNASVATPISIQKETKQILWAGGVFNSLLSYTKNLGWMKPSSYLKNTEPYETEFSDFGVAMVRTETLKRSGFFDESYFLYLNGLELSLRIRRTGGSIWVIPYVICSTIGQASTDLEKGYKQRIAPITLFYYSKEYVIFVKKEYKRLISRLIRLVTRTALVMPYFIIFRTDRGKFLQSIKMAIIGSLHGLEYSMPDRPQHEHLTIPSETLRVVIVGSGAREIPPKGYGGVEKYIAQLSKLIKNDGVDVEVVNKVMPGGSDLLKHIFFSGYFICQVRKFRDRVFHVNTPLPAILLGILGYDYVYTTHSRYWFGKPPFFRALFHISDILAVCLSRISIASSSLMYRKFNELKCKGVTFVLIPIQGLEIYGLRANTNQERKRLVVGFGAVIPAKRHDILAEASKDVVTDVIIIGPIFDSALKQKLQSINPKITFLGEVNEDKINDVLSQAKVLVHEADFEGFPSTVVRAMAFGVPVIGSSIVSEAIKDGETGFIIPSYMGDSERIKETRSRITQILEDDALFKKMGENCTRYIESKYSSDEIIRLHENTYISLSNVITKRG
ncbi:MAG: glycosyltransferase [Thermoplasmatales archaeon]|jgi:GT2 family glycosyltransferase/glycosyltransferase involved in cell wall biosynthesis|nr:glycosyltransferase [Candidatus Thermoplasmatota archaeon]MDA8055895.1 glycosyltransferase [Thermoplasmatales archaeon]